MEAEPKRKRHWYQFRLRTLMIVVTLLAMPLAYVGRQAKIVRERRDFTAAHGDSVWWDGKDEQLPWIRRCLGDTARRVVALPLDSTKALRERAAALFPEALIVANETRQETGDVHSVVWQFTNFPDEGVYSTKELFEWVMGYNARKPVPH